MEADDDLTVPGDDSDSFFDGNWLKKLVGADDDTDAQAIKDLRQREENLFKKEEVAQSPVVSVQSSRDEENLDKINISELERQIRGGDDPNYFAVEAAINVSPGPILSGQLGRQLSRNINPTLPQQLYRSLQEKGQLNEKSFSKNLGKVKKKMVREEKQQKFEDLRRKIRDVESNRSALLRNQDMMTQKSSRIQPSRVTPQKISHPNLKFFDGKMHDLS